MLIPGISAAGLRNVQHIRRNKEGCSLMAFAWGSTKICIAVLEWLLLSTARMTGRLQMWHAEQFGAACEKAA